MPAHNAARFIRQAVESVLAQSHANVELVVVDDGSTDDTWKVLEVFRERCKLLQQPNSGPGAARNNGLRAATGDYACFLDADDLLLPEALATLVKRVREDPPCDVTVGWWQMVDEQGHPASAVQKPESEFEALGGDAVRALQIRCCWHVAAAVVKMELVRDHGGWDERLRAAEDQDLWLRLALQGARFGFVKTPVSSYRRHTSNTSLQVTGQEKALLLFLQKWYGPSSPLPVEARALEPYARASFWFYLAQKSRDTGRDGEATRLARLACDALARVAPDSALLERVLWDAYLKPWEAAVHEALWPKASSQVAEVCWVHLREALRRRKIIPAGKWCVALARRRPALFLAKLRRLRSRQTAAA
jgi:glycosyltransferase involved in cell wall biosynthesis